MTRLAAFLAVALAGCASAGTTPDRVYTRIACDPGTADCDGMLHTGCETRTATNPTACGACGHACASGQACFDGTCRH